MSIELSQLTKYLEECLEPGRFADYCPNGLQVEGCGEVTRLVTGVTACQQLLDAAVSCSAQAILVHHGYFWKNEDATITGIKRKRIQRLLENGVSLLAYHLPLDAHEVYGNNITLAQKLGIKVTGYETQGSAKGLLWNGELDEETDAYRDPQSLAPCGQSTHPV